MKSLLLGRGLRQWAFALAMLLSSGLLAAADDQPSGDFLFPPPPPTTDAVEQIRAEFLKLHPHVQLKVSYGASSTLAKQAAAGAGADLFLSASSDWAESLTSNGLVARQRDLASNQLVVITPADSRLMIRDLADLAKADVKRLALADPKSVPAGVYARQALERLSLWKELQVKVAGAADVRQALQFVETGAAEAGIVYLTDATASKQVRIALRVDPQLSDPIRYPLLLLKHGESNPVAVSLYDFMAGTAGAQILTRHGFLPPKS